MTTVQILPARNATLKAVDDVDRVIEGIASSGRVDNHGEILQQAGATWDCPLPLLSDHQPNIQIGEVLAIWRADDKLRFRASLFEDGDTWQRIISRRKLGVSVGFDPLDDEKEGGVRHVKRWRIVEISIVDAGSNTDAKIERVEHRKRTPTVSTTKALPVVAIDPPEPPKEPSVPVITSQQQPAWHIRGVAEPLLKGLSIHDVLDQYPALLDHYSDVIARKMKDIGVSPTALVNHNNMSVTDGALLAIRATLQQIALIVDQRLAKLEDGQQKFAGVHQRALAYQKGSLCVHQGSLWVALKDVPEGAVPGSDSFYWQLAAKGADR